MLTRKILKIEHEKKKHAIRDRLDRFSKNNINERKKFLELCFCLCTPQSKAVKVASVIHAGNIDKLLSCSLSDLSGMLKTNTRFHNNKAKYIIGARRYIPDLKKLPRDSILAREFLVKNIKGLGYKEASHFLRNIGYRNLCIIDRHLISLMHELNVFTSSDPPKNPRQYLAMEDSIREFAKEMKIDVDELDLLLWSIKTGYVFK